MAPRLRTAALVTTAAVGGVAMAIRYQANALRANELAQQNGRTGAVPAPISASASSSASTSTSTSSSNMRPNLYVSVDRSGGGI